MKQKVHAQIKAKGMESVLRSQVLLGMGLPQSVVDRPSVVH